MKKVNGTSSMYLANCQFLQDEIYHKVEKEWKDQGKIDAEELEYVYEHVLESGAKYKGSRIFSNRKRISEEWN